MLVLVDTTVWIDFFAAKSAPHVKFLENLIEKKEDICICGIILTEVLQGIKEEKEYKKTKDIITSLLFIPMSYKTFMRAAEIYRGLRQKGITIRKAMDCMIASAAIEFGIPLLHNDRDFKPIEMHFGLKVFK